MALIDDLQDKVKTLNDFYNLTYRVLNYLPEVTSTTSEDKDYIIIKSATGRSLTYSRPYNKILFISEPEDFNDFYKKFISILKRIKIQDDSFTSTDYDIIDRVTYTIQQSIGIALDLLGNQNANRKHVGNRFEELISLIVSEIGISNKKIVLKIPYDDKGVYSCETDFVFSPYESVKSNNKTIDEKEVVVSLKTSSKDRMGKIFIDKILMSKFVKRDVKVLGIFLNDIQRKKEEKVGYTFVAGLFMVYTNFLAKLDGVYFIDPPKNATIEPYSNHINRFSEFIIKDAYKLINKGI